MPLNVPLAFSASPAGSVPPVFSHEYVPKPPEACNAALEVAPLRTEGSGEVEVMSRESGTTTLIAIEPPAVSVPFENPLPKPDALAPAVSTPGTTELNVTCPLPLVAPVRLGEVNCAGGVNVVFVKV